jgi:hypothetical protein
MVGIARMVSFVSLVGTLAPAVLFFLDSMTLDEAKRWMLVATAAWFATSPLWMDRPAR